VVTILPLSKMVTLPVLSETTTETAEVFLVIPEAARCRDILRIPPEGVEDRLVGGGEDMFLVPDDKGSAHGLALPAGATDVQGNVNDGHDRAE
jgi:hypothetical protein